MMASARSPSPNPSRPSNPSPKTPEYASVVSKKGTFSPSKTGISSEISQRSTNFKSSCAIASPCASFEQKENESDINSSKPAKTRFPAMNPSKGMKGFMAPTISASSKVAVASTRKKILSERNEVVQDSVNSSVVLVEGVGMEEIKPISNICLDSEELSCQKISRMMDFSVPTGQIESTCSHPSASCSLDSDPSLPPYDPRTNFLSPRPQYLHYRPKPTIEDLFDASGGRRLEDCFTDSEGSDNYSESAEGTQSSKKLDEDDASSMLNTHEALVPVETHITEPMPRAKTNKPIVYSSSLMKPKVVSFILFLSIVFIGLPMADLPIHSKFLMKYEPFHGSHIPSFEFLEGTHLKDYLALANQNIEILISKLKQWLADCVAVFSSSDTILREESGMLHYFNMTLSPSLVQNKGLGFGFSSEFVSALNNDIVEEPNDPVKFLESDLEFNEVVHDPLVGNAIDDGGMIKTEFFYEEDKNPKYEEENLNPLTIRLSIKQSEFELDKTNAIHNPFVGDDQITNLLSDTNGDAVILEKEDGYYPVELEIVQMLEEEVFVDLRQNNSYVINENITFELSGVNEDRAGVEIVDKEDESKGLGSFIDQKPMKIGYTRSEKVDAEHYLEQFGMQEQMLEEQALIKLSEEGLDSSPIDYAGESQTMNQKEILAAMVISGVLAGVVLATILVSLFMKKKFALASSSENLLNKTFGGSASYNRDYNESPCRNLAGFVDAVGDSGPTEMSSSLNNGSSHLKKKMTPSPEVLQRRDSGVSSISYGSFTAFEKISGRKGEKDEEVITPVRRSSRIRNLAISP